MTYTTRWPSSWNSRILRMSTVWPRWMSGAVGSKPTLTVSGRPRPSLARRAPSVTTSTHPFVSRSRSATTPSSVEVEAAALAAEPAREQDAHRPRIDPVLGLQDAGRQLVGAVLLQHGHRLLGHDGPRVEALVHHVDGGPADLHPVLPGLALRVLPREGGKQRGVHVQDAVGKGAQED